MAAVDVFKKPSLAPSKDLFEELRKVRAAQEAKKQTSEGAHSGAKAVNVEAQPVVAKPEESAMSELVGSAAPVEAGPVVVAGADEQVSAAVQAEPVSPAVAAEQAKAEQVVAQPVNVPVPATAAPAETAAAKVADPPKVKGPKGKTKKKGNPPEAPWGFKADGTPRAKPGRKPGQKNKKKPPMQAKANKKSKVAKKTPKAKNKPAKKIGANPIGFGQNGPQIKLATADLNDKETAVLKNLAGVSEEIAPKGIRDIATEAFPDMQDTKANSWVRNALRRLVRAKLAEPVARGKYRLSKKAWNALYSAAFEGKAIPQGNQHAA